MKVVNRSSIESDDPAFDLKSFRTKLEKIHLGPPPRSKPPPTPPKPPSTPSMHIYEIPVVRIDKNVDIGTEATEMNTYEDILVDTSSLDSFEIDSWDEAEPDQEQITQ